MIPLTAWLNDRFGRKQYSFFPSPALPSLPSSAAFPPPSAMLVLARILQGLAGGGLLAKAQSSCSRLFPRAAAGRPVDFRHRGHRRPGLRPGPGRLWHGMPGLALDFFHQLAGGNSGSCFMTFVFLPRDDQAGAHPRRAGWMDRVSACSPWDWPASRRCWSRDRRTIGSASHFIPHHGDWGGARHRVFHLARTGDRPSRGRPAGPALSRPGRGQRLFLSSWAGYYMASSSPSPFSSRTTFTIRPCRAA